MFALFAIQMSGGTLVYWRLELSIEGLRDELIHQEMRVIIREVTQGGMGMYIKGGDQYQLFAYGRPRSDLVLRSNHVDDLTIFPVWERTEDIRRCHHQKMAVCGGTREAPSAQGPEL